MDLNKNLNTDLKSLPSQPGVYRFLNREGKVIYVGKARDLKKRVGSYFSGKPQSAKEKILVKNIARIETIVVDTEYDALLLENSMIKELQPRYNILLKDDKTYPWICIKKERFPRVFPTRTLVRDGSEYFGPYASVKVMNNLLELIRGIFPLRNCTFDLSEENIAKKKFRICLEYQIGNCLGPCEGLQSQVDYDDSIKKIRAILRGKSGEVARSLKEEIQKYVSDLAFEKAQKTKEKLLLLEKFQAKSTVVSPQLGDLDVFSVHEDQGTGYLNFFRVSEGAIVGSHNMELKQKLEENSYDFLLLGLTELLRKFPPPKTPWEIIVPFSPEIEFPGIRFTVPARGDKKQLLDLSDRNAVYFKLESKKRESLVDPERHTKRILETLKKDLRLKDLPRHMECFDNSNFQGSEAVAACVVFKNAKPAKKEYRHFNIKTVEGPDDFASMEEVVYRRYKRQGEENQPLPDLIIIDGGKGQLSAARKSLEKLGLSGKIPVIGIAKRLEEIYFPGDPHPLYLDKKSESLKVIQHMRDEAHRFGITHHRSKRGKAVIKSELNEIPGISAKTTEKLLRTFKSVPEIKNASREELEKIVGPSKAEKILSFFEKKKE